MGGRGPQKQRPPGFVRVCGGTEQGPRIFRASQYVKAVETFDRLSPRPKPHADYSLAARAGSNAGASHFALHQYQPALESFLRARRIQESLGDANYLP